MASIKVKYKNDIRRVTLPEPLSYVKLRDIICVLYRSTQLPTNFVVKYVDDENDYISITSDIELEEACACAKKSTTNILRMFISEPGQDGKAEELPLRKDFDVHPQQSNVVTQSQLVSIEQILNSKEVLQQQQQQHLEKQRQLEEQQRIQQERQEQQRQQQLEEERRREIEEQQKEHQLLMEKHRQLEQQRLQEEQRQIEEQQRLQEAQQREQQQNKREQAVLQQQQSEKGGFMAVFVEDVGIQDGAIFAPGVEFEKIWRMKNTGVAPWPVGTQLAFKVGDKLSGSSDVFQVAQLARPGETVNISAVLRAPIQSGRYIAYFRLIGPDGSHFGHRIWADIVVEEKDYGMEIDHPHPQLQLQPQPQPQPEPQPEPIPAKTPLNAELENAIDQMVSLGFPDRSVNAEALRRASGSLEEALNLLLDGRL